MKKLLSLFLIFTCLFASAQQANDCSDAIVLCGNTNISSNATGFGTQELDAMVNPCGSEEINSLWLSVNIATSGTLAFTIRPDDTDLEVDYDFYIFGPNNGCSNFDTPIRCNTTNPLQASLNYNTTGLRDSEPDESGGPGALGNGYASSIPATTGEQYYILIDRPIGNGGFNLEWTGTAGFLTPPAANDPINLEICAAESSSLVDLTQNESAITTSNTVTISYHESYEDAFDFTNQIVDPTQFQFMATFETIYVRVANPNGCFEIVDFDLIPLRFDNPPDLSYTVCDTDRDGQGDFNIPEIVLDGENAFSNIMEYILSLHPTETDALSNTNRITATSWSAANTTIYARVNSAILSDCFITYPISLSVNSPEFPASIPLVQCDVDLENSIDGLTRLNLEQAILDTQNANISYYETTNDRDMDNPITNPSNYINTTPFNQVIYYRAITNNCESLGEILLEVNPTIVSLNTMSPIQRCDENTDESINKATFDLESIRQNSYAGLDVAFYENIEDVSLEENPLDGNYTTGTTTLFVRLETNNQCQGVEELELVVQPLPEVFLEENYQVCTDGEPLLIDAPTGFSSYSWQKIEDGQIEEISIDLQVAIDEGGNYRLEVETLFQSNGETLNCSSSTDFTVTPSNRATIVEILIDASTRGNLVEVEVIGDGDYEFSLDGENFQESPNFDNVESGFQTVFVRDKNGCGITQREISVLGFPKFFTPNGDGANDTWQIIGADKNLEDREINIFDRYGKLVKQISTNTIGWDGQMNGKPLPSSDYWFKITLDNGKELKGHFSLKR